MNLDNNKKSVLPETERLTGDQKMEFPMHDGERREQPRRKADQYMTDAVAEGVRQGLLAAMKDEELMESFWQKGFEQLTDHAGTNASQWVGKRILIAAIAAIFLLSLNWLVKNGKIT